MDVLQSMKGCLKMKLQKAPLKHTCLVTAFAMVLGTDAQNMIDSIGSDPHQVLWPQHQEPQCFRGHHIQEMIDYAMCLGYSVTEIQAAPRFGTLGCTETFEVWDEATMMRRIQNKVSEYAGVITSPTHAVAWDGHNVFDPCGKIYPIEDYHDQIQSFYIIAKL